MNEVAPTAIDADTLHRARRAAAERGTTLVSAVALLTGDSETTVVRRLALQLCLRSLDGLALQSAVPDFSRWSFAEASRSHCVVAVLEGRHLLLMADPFAEGPATLAEARMQVPLEPVLAHPGDLEAWLARQEESLRAMPQLASTDGKGSDVEQAEEISLLAIADDDSPVVRVVSSTLYDAIKAEASDIHFETRPDGLHVFYRIDGVLTPAAHVTDVELSRRAVSRIKVLGELDIAETRIPQDGRFKVAVQGRQVDFRVSVMPSLHGEDVVLRILDKRHLVRSGASMTLQGLGFDTRSIDTLREFITQPYGMVLLTGPTGSGKTTTLYAALSEINTGRDKIITIEDPVEYQLPGILQIPVNEKKGMGFARGLRSILRHDPDKILVGEIRDTETAQIAIQSALTGHLVFTSVHANSAFDVFGRFIHMGVDPYSFVSALNVVVAQRLLRVNCTHCAEPVVPSPRDLSRVQLPSDGAGVFMAGRGCAHCRGTGYRGRQAIAEILPMTRELRDLVQTRAPVGALREAAWAAGTRSLRDSALALAWQGRTTVEEVCRVTLAA
jgi:general secretion pathway protein E